jgi:hypothetical protein
VFLFVNKIFILRTRRGTTLCTNVLIILLIVTTMSFENPRDCYFLFAVDGIVFLWSDFVTGYSVAQLFEVLYYKAKSRGFDFRWGF